MNLTAASVVTVLKGIDKIELPRILNQILNLITIAFLTVIPLYGNFWCIFCLPGGATSRLQ